MTISFMYEAVPIKWMRLCRTRTIEVMIVRILIFYLLEV